MSQIIDTKSGAAVAGLVHRVFGELYPGAPRAWIEQVFGDVEALFEGRHPDYSPIDLRYHNLEHTLQATVCLIELLAGRHRSDAAPHASARQVELTIIAVLLHDTGYLKLRGDTAGTGAKYTFCHVLRSCAFAASYLPSLGANPREIEAVIGAINCTGPSHEIGRLQFREPVERVLGCALATADYLGQLAAPDYPEKVDLLFAEFAESDDFTHVPPSDRVFRSARHLLEQTPQFWDRFVIPRLNEDFGGLYRFLAAPFPDGANAYLAAAERNIAIIRRRLAAPTGI
jgi:hypothetical protein